MAEQNADSVRRYDGGTEHADWCPDHEHEGKCLDRLLERIDRAAEQNDRSERIDG
jgi:hypothetical protein